MRKSQDVANYFGRAYPLGWLGPYGPNRKRPPVSWEPLLSGQEIDEQQPLDDFSNVDFDHYPCLEGHLRGFQGSGAPEPVKGFGLLGHLPDWPREGGETAPGRRLARRPGMPLRYIVQGTAVGHKDRMSPSA